MSKMKQLRKLLESEVDQAESIIAARGFSQELQDMLQSLGRLLNEDLPTVSEQMRNSLGPDIATAFEDQTTEVLQTVMDQLRDGKQSIDNSVAEISAGGVPSGGSNDMEDDEFNDLGDDDLDLDLDDEEMDDEEMDDDEDPFAGADVSAGPDEEPLGRPQRESVQSLKRKIAEAKRMIARAKKLREGRRSRNLDGSEPGFAHGYAGDVQQGRLGDDPGDPWDKRAFKRQEMEHELGNEEEEIRAANRGPFYLKIDGKYLKTRGEVKEFSHKNGAIGYGRAMMKNRPSLKGKIYITKVHPEDVSGLSESRMAADMDPDKPIKVSGVKGKDSKRFTKKFRNQAAYEKWIDSEDSDDFDVQQVENA